MLFDDRYDMVYDHTAIGKVEPLTDKEYYPRGSTRLLDAIGKTINHVGNRHKYAPNSRIPSKTLVVVITDGHENASREYSLPQVKALIEHQKEKYGWEFLFLGANIDAVSTAAGFGISADRAVTYKADHKGTKMNFYAVSEVASCFRKCASIRSNWKQEIEEHNREKSRKY